MWAGIGKLIGGLFSSVLGTVLGWFKKNKLEEEAARGRAAKEYLRSEDEAGENERRQRELQGRLAEEDKESDSDNLFNR